MLTDDEKRFVALFVENYRYLIKPRYKNFISLFSYLDDTNESEKHQQRGYPIFCVNGVKGH